MISSDGRVQTAGMDNLLELFDMAQQVGVSLHLTTNPYIMGNPAALPAALREVVRAIDFTPDTAWGIDVANEEDRRQPLDRVKALVEAVKGETTKQRLVTCSLSGSIEFQTNRLREFSAAGIVLDYVASHPKRDEFWGERNRPWFESMRAAFNDAIFVADDEGRRVGDQNAGGTGPDPGVDDFLAASLGAKQAGCIYFIMHTAAFFTPGGVFTPVETEAFIRIPRESLGLSAPVPPPPPPPGEGEDRC